MTDTNVTPIRPAAPARTQALKTMNQIVAARARITGTQTGPTTEQALATAPGSYVVVGPWDPLRYVSISGGWTADPRQALVWDNTQDLLRACYKLNVSGLRIIGAPTADELAADAALIHQANTTRANALAANQARTQAKRAKRLAQIRGTEPAP